LNTFSRSVIRSFVLTLAFAGLLAGTSMAAAGPVWMPGFPLRAGAAVIIMWTPVPGATEYKLLKQMGTPDFKEVYKGPINTFNDTDAPSTKTIVYKVVGVVGGKDTDPSPPAELKGIEPLKPPTFTGNLPSADAITLRWTNPPGSMFFNLYRAEAKTGPFELLGSIQQETYTDRKVAKGKTYFYQVSAVDRVNTESDKSEIVEAKLVEVKAAVDTKPNIIKPVPKGEFLGEELYELEQPKDIGWSKSGELYVADRTGIQFFDKDGKFVHRINFDKSWTVPSGCTIDKDGNYLLAFYGEQLLRKIDAEGKLLWAAKYPLAEGKPANNPNYVIPDPDGAYWITDGVRYQLLKGTLDKDEFKIGTTIGRISGTYDAKTRTPEDLPGVFKTVRNPYTGNLYALLGPTIKVIDPKTGKVTKEFGGFGLDNDKFQQVGDIFFKKNGNYLVLDPMMNQVKEFGKDFAYIATYANEVKPGIIKLSSNFSTGFTFDEASNRMYISSGMGNRVYMFDLPK
jgi:hypothetical protein